MFFALSCLSHWTLPMPPLEDDAMTTEAAVQVRYLLGDAGNSYVVGFGHKPPQYAAIQSATCPARPAACVGTQAEQSATLNPIVATGALIRGDPLDGDRISNVRSDTSNSVTVSLCRTCYGPQYKPVLSL